jgi:hypothetical protein
MRLPPNAAGGPRQCCFPLQFSPFGNPLSRFPLSKLNPPKGDNRRGTQHGGFPVRRTERGPLSRSFSVRRTPPPCGLPDATPPLSHPLRLSPLAGAGALVRPTPVRAAHTAPAFCGVGYRRPRLRATPLAPFAPLAGGQARWFCGGARGRARKCACKTRVGLRPTPRLYARVIRRVSFTNPHK